MLKSQPRLSSVCSEPRSTKCDNLLFVEFLSECRQLLTPKSPKLEPQTTRMLTEQECCTATDDMCMSGCVSTCYDDKDYDNQNSDRKASCHKICTSGSSSGRLKCGQLCPGRLITLSNLHRMNSIKLGYIYRFCLAYANDIWERLKLLWRQ